MGQAERGTKTKKKTRSSRGAAGDGWDKCGADESKGAGRRLPDHAPTCRRSCTAGASVAAHSRSLSSSQPVTTQVSDSRLLQRSTQ